MTWWVAEVCRLLGIRANQPVDLEFSLIGGNKAFRDFGKGNPDGWGMGWYEGDGPHVHKEPISAVESRDLPRMAARAYSDAFICHVRLATQGEPNQRNCHPFQFGDWLFAHNGSVPRSPLLAELEGKHREAIEGDTDSEVYFHWILQSIDRHDGDVVAGLRSALHLLDTAGNYSGLNFILSNGDSLYAYREAGHDHDYYSLHYLSRDPRDPSPETLESELGALISSKSLRGERATLVSSETLTNEAWKEIPLGYLLAVSADLELQLERVR
jgi:predicted glutamine amidotransferase